MAIKGIEVLEKTLQQHNGEDAIISISHKLYGNQKIKCTLNCIVNGNHIGFQVNDNQKIYMYRDEIKEFCVSPSLFFMDDVMRVDLQIK